MSRAGDHSWRSSVTSLLDRQDGDGPPVAQRFSWGMADQAMCSVSNAAVSFYVARELGATKFGAFSLAYVTYSFALNASRGLATDPLLVRFSGTNRGHVAAGQRAQTTGTALMTAWSPALCAMAAALAAPRHDPARLPGARTDPARLAAARQLAVLVLRARARQSGVPQRHDLDADPGASAADPADHALEQRVLVVVAWGIAATVAACIGPLQARVIPRPSLAWAWESQTSRPRVPLPDGEHRQQRCGPAAHLRPGRHRGPGRGRLRAGGRRC